jgi:hypothetical protein
MASVLSSYGSPYGEDEISDRVSMKKNQRNKQKGSGSGSGAPAPNKVNEFLQTIQIPDMPPSQPQGSNPFSHFTPNYEQFFKAGGMDADSDGEESESGLGRAFQPPPKPHSVGGDRKTRQQQAPQAPQAPAIEYQPILPQKREGMMNMTNENLQMQAAPVPTPTPAPYQDNELQQVWKTPEQIDAYYQSFFPKRGAPPRRKIQETGNPMMDKLNYLIHLMEEQHMEKTAHITEETILYLFMGVFVIFVVDSFAKVGKYRR